MTTRRDALLAMMSPALAADAHAHAAASGPGAKAAFVGLFADLQTEAVPADVSVIKTSGYTRPGLGAARYVATAAEGRTRYRAQSRDGRWFELAESQVTPQMFGAVGGAGVERVDDTEAMQAWLDYLKANAAWNGHGSASQGGGRLPAGTYLVTRSLDFTSEGEPLGGRTILGDDEQNTIILGELAEPFPVLDATNAYAMHLEGFQIRCSKASKATCCLLLAQDRDNRFITYNNSLERLRLVLDHEAPNGVAALVVQNNDLLKIGNVKGQGAVGLSVGWRLPVLRRAAARGGGADTIVLDAQASPVDGAYVGLPLRLVDGAGAGAPGQAVDPISRPAIGRIVAYDGATRTAKVDRAWPRAPDASTTFELYSVASKFKTPQSHDDATHYALNNSCSFTGRKAIVITGVPGGAVDLGDTYAASEHELDSDRCGVLVASSHPSDARLGPLNIFGRNFRTENQARGTPFYAIRNASGQAVSVDIQGSLTVGRVDSQAPSAIFADADAKGFADINVQGLTLDDGVLLFALGGAVRTLRGSMRCMLPGHVDGGIGSFDFDWQVGAWDRNWIPFVLSTARHVARTGSGEVAPAGARIHVPGLDGAVWASRGFTLGCPCVQAPYPGDGRPRAVASWTVPAGVLAYVAPVVRSLTAEAGLESRGDGVLDVHLRQSTPKGELRVALARQVPVRSGARGLLRLTLQHGGAGFRAMGELRFEAQVAHLAGASNDLAGLSADLPIVLEIGVASRAASPLEVGAHLIRID